MSTVSTTKLSSKGQVVIPEDIRKNTAVRLFGILITIIVFVVKN